MCGGGGMMNMESAAKGKAMGNCPLCNLESVSTPSEVKRSAGFLGRAVGRAWRSVQWVFPAALLVVVPKCPLCVAAYIALFTGVGVSVSTARWIQILMVVCCVGSLAYVGARFWRGIGPARSRRNPRGAGG